MAMVEVEQQVKLEPKFNVRYFAENCTGHELSGGGE